MPSDDDQIVIADVVHPGGSVVVYIRGELDVASAPVLHRYVEGLIDARPGALTLDLTGLRFVDVAGLRALLEVQRTVSDTNVAFSLREVDDHTLRLIRLTGFSRLEDAMEVPGS